MRGEYAFSQRRACGLMTMAVSSYRYQSRRSDEPLRTRLVELAREKPRFGYRRLHVLLGRSGEHVNHKRVHRVYRAAGLMIRRKKRKHCARVGQPLRIWTAANQEWALDFVHDAVECGRAIRVLSVVDGSFVEANAAKESRIPREQLAEAAQVNRSVRQYLVDLEQQNPVEEPVHQQDQVSTTDPDSTYATKGGTPARLGYYDNYLVDNHSCVIVGVQATAARMSQETVAAQDMLTRFAQWQGREPESVAADTTYGNGEFLQWLADRSITPYMRTRDSIHRKRSPFFGPERFTYEPEHDRYICPAGQPLNYGGQSHRNQAWTYIGTRKRCGPCALRPQCTSAAFRCLVIHQHEPARQRARELANTPEFAKAQRQRKKVEALFAELKNRIGLRRLRLRRLKFVREQFFLAAAAQNLKRLVRFLSQPTTPAMEAAT